MAKYTKPTLQIAWAETGDTTPPLTSKISTGWVAERPPHEYANFVENRQDTFLRYINQLGIPEWDATTEYQEDLSYVQGASGTVYRAKQTNTNRNPDADISFTYWGIAFDIYGAAAAVQANLDILNGKYPNLTGVNAANGRTNLSVYSKAEIDAMVGAVTIPVGSIMMFPSVSVPAKWVECDGRAVSRTGSYAALFAACGIAYGVGDGVTTFNIPDFRGVFPRGFDNGKGIDAGRVLGSSQNGAIESHQHTTSNGGSAYMMYADGGQGVQAFLAPNGATRQSVAGDSSKNKSTFTGGTETRPKNLSVVFCIYTGV